VWTTPTYLKKCLDIIDAWNFTYVSEMIWIKDKMGLGFYARYQHESLLIATKGKFLTPEPAFRPRSTFFSPRLEHSRKPEIVYKFIESMYPTLPRIELFARSPRQDWYSWGNEVHTSKVSETYQS
jgi:N6-adenosine-specific RNA methylase IME4